MLLDFNAACSKLSSYSSVCSVEVVFSLHALYIYTYAAFNAVDSSVLNLKCCSTVVWLSLSLNFLFVYVVTVKYKLQWKWNLQLTRKSCYFYCKLCCLLSGITEGRGIWRNNPWLKRKTKRCKLCSHLDMYCLYLLCNCAYL